MFILPQAGLCLCSDTTFLSNTSPSCGEPCTADPRQSCGNGTHIAVPVDPVARARPIANLSVVPDPVIAGRASELIANGAVLDSDVQLRFDPGDGSPTTRLTSNRTVSHVYSTSGDFVAVLTIQKYSLVRGLFFVVISKIISN